MSNKKVTRKETKEIQLKPQVSEEYQILPEMGIFRTLSTTQRANLARYGEFFYAAASTRVVAQGYFQDSLYLLLSGELEVFVDSGSGDKKIATLEPGDSVGEANLFYPTDATASVFISEDCQLWRIEKSQMANFIIAYPQDGLAIVAEIICLMSKRMERQNLAGS